MMLLLAHLIRKSKIWKNTKLRIFTVAQLEDDSLKMKADLRKILYELRIQANVSVIEMSSQDISPYTYERTITMAERTKMMEQMGLSRRQVKRTFSYVAESAHKPGTSGERKNSVMQDIDDAQAALAEAGELEEEEEVAAPVSKDLPTVRISQLNSGQILAMDTSVKLNQLVKEHSSDAAMIMLNMPAPPTVGQGQEQATSDANYVEFLDVLTEGLGRVLLVRGSGMEVVTVYS